VHSSALSLFDGDKNTLRVMPALAVFADRRPATVWGSLPARSVKESYLVDPASSHMLVSKIKPCMSKYKHLYSETANGSLNQL
jgi:hypothetical protein